MGQIAIPASASGGGKNELPPIPTDINNPGTLVHGQQSFQAGNFYAISEKDIKNITKFHVNHGNSITFGLVKIQKNGRAASVASIQTGNTNVWYEATINLTDAVAVGIWYNGAIVTSRLAKYYFS